MGKIVRGTAGFFSGSQSPDIVMLHKVAAKGQGLSDARMRITRPESILRLAAPLIVNTDATRSLPGIKNTVASRFSGLSAPRGERRS